MLPLRTAVCQSDNLGRAFARYRRYRGLWAPGVPMFGVTSAPVVPMLQLAEDLRSGRYRPSPPHVLSVAKADGGKRELRVFAIRDRVAQRALLQVLQGRTDGQMSPCSFGYRPGRGVAGAVARVRAFFDLGLWWVVDADVERCFDSIPRRPLLDEVTRRLQSPEAAELVAQWLDWPSPTAQEIGIPQGSVLAPWLCNLYLWQLDDAMKADHAAMVRFADDFVLLSAAREEAEGLRRHCAEVMERMRLRLHPVKTAVRDASRPFRFLGQWLRATPLLARGPVLAGGSGG